MNYIIPALLSLGGILLAVFAFLYSIRAGKELDDKHATTLDFISKFTLGVALVAFVATLFGYLSVSCVWVFGSIITSCCFILVIIGSFVITLLMLTKL